MLLPMLTILWRRSSQYLHSSLLAATPVPNLEFLRFLSLLLHQEEFALATSSLYSSIRAFEATSSTCLDESERLD